MARKITATIRADVEVITTEEEERLLKRINEASLNVDDDYETYDNLMNELEELIAKRLEGNLKDVTVLDINWD